MCACTGVLCMQLVHLVDSRPTGLTVHMLSLQYVTIKTHIYFQNLLVTSTRYVNKSKLNYSSWVWTSLGRQWPWWASQWTNLILHLYKYYNAGWSLGIYPMQWFTVWQCVHIIHITKCALIQYNFSLNWGILLLHMFRGLPLSASDMVYYFLTMSPTLPYYYWTVLLRDGHRTFGTLGQ